MQRLQTSIMLPNGELFWPFFYEMTASIMSFQGIPQRTFKPVIEMISVVGAEALSDGVVLYRLIEHSARSHLAVQVQHNTLSCQSSHVLCFVTLFVMGVPTSSTTPDRRLYRIR
jgi:hypothetical protein